jgi:alkanesulfonate monooxygenase SsuD/methylene tetrahydromethanopterin reductase-like flavin-dependent oxidoreductase (luciferase family)
LTYDSEDIANFDLGQLFPIVAAVPEEVVKSTALIGSPEEIRKTIQEFISAGAQSFCFEIINGVSKRNAPYTYFDVSRILAEDIYPALEH